MVDVKKLMVPWLEGQTHTVYSQIDTAWKHPRLKRMMANEAPIAPSRAVLRALRRGARLAHRYPDSLDELRRKIGKVNSGLGEDWVLLGNGSNEILDMILRAFLSPGDELVQSTPCYGFYRQRASILGAKTVSVPSRENWEYDVDGLEQAVTEKTRTIVLANPNNPTGNLIDDSVYERLVQKEAILLCDEAYIEYSGFANSKVHLVKKYPNMLISRTLSKAYGLAGMRLGYALGHPETVEIVSRTAMAWNINIMSAFGALAALDDLKGLQERVRINNEGRDYLERELSGIYGVKVSHSYGNYILFDASAAGVKSSEIVRYVMEKHGIIIRTMNPVAGKEGFCRITIGSKGENRRCVEALRDFFENGSARQR